MNAKGVDNNNASNIHYTAFLALILLGKQTAQDPRETWAKLKINTQLSIRVIFFTFIFNSVVENDLLYI